MTPAATGRPAYHPSALLKIYLYGYLNRVQSSRRLERETQRNIDTDVADRTPHAGFRRRCRFPQGQRASDQGDLPPVRNALPDGWTCSPRP